MNQSSSAFCPSIDGPGLQIVIAGGSIQCANVLTVLPTTVVPLTANATNFVYIKFVSAANPSASGTTPVIAASTDATKAPDGILVCTVTTGNSGIVSLIDNRPDLIFL